ncbi:chitobiase/beta-hexosaminidase C-terminal domain-containing protein [Dyadobacter jejuensis]|nr:FN3 associated domain-containing protein [Dyadobacter jejuensis]
MKSIAFFLLLLSHFSIAKDFYVSPQGKDTHAGTTSDNPLASLAQALERSKGVLATESVHIYLMPGSHYVSEALVLDRAYASGSGHQLVIEGIGENVVVKGSALLKNLVWRTYRGEVKVAAIPSDLRFDQLFVNEALQVKARFPNYDYANPWRGGLGYQLASDGGDRRYDSWMGVDSTVFSQKVWENPETGIVHAFQSHNWGNMQYKILSRDRTKHQLKLGDGGWQLQRMYGIGKGTPFFIENIFEELDAPGEWFYDERQHLLYYWPPAGLDLHDALVEVPVVKDIIQIKGTPEQPVKNIHLKNIRFTQAKTTFMDAYEPLARGDWSIHRGGAIFMEGAEDCVIDACDFDDLGGNAVFMSGYNRNNMVRNAQFSNLGESAVCFVGKPSAVRFYQTWDDAEIHHKDWEKMRQGMDLGRGPKSPDYPENCVVENAIIHDIGLLGKQTAGVFISMSHHIRASHVSIYNTPRAGICINDGTWGGHIIEHCDIWETVKETGEHGPFNSWGRERQWKQGSGGMIKDYVLLDAIDPVIIRNNRISNFRKTISAGNWTIDLDDGSSNYEIYNNLSLGSTLKMRDGYFRKAYNNIMVSPVPLGWHVWPEESGDRFTNNIVVIAGKVPGKEVPTQHFIGPARMPQEGRWGDIHDQNVYWNANTDKALVYGDVTFENWQSQGYDQHSKLANPSFVNPGKMDFRVQEHSPAIGLGFKNFPMDQFGHTMTKIGPFWKEFTGTLQISLTADKRGEKVYYTTDGSQPSTGSQLYTQPFTIHESSLIKAATVDSQGKRVGPIQAEFYTKVDRVKYPSWYQTLLSGKTDWDFESYKFPQTNKHIDGLELINIQEVPDLIDASGGYATGCFVASIDTLGGEHWRKAGLRPHMIVQGMGTESIISTDDFEAALKKYAGQKVSVKTVYAYENQVFEVQLK